MKYLFLFLPIFAFSYRPPIGELMKNMQYEPQERQGALLSLEILDEVNSHTFQAKYYLNDVNNRRECFQEIIELGDNQSPQQAVYLKNVFEKNNLFLSIISSMVKGDAMHLKSILKTQKSTTQIKREEKRFYWVNETQGLTSYFDVMSKRLEKAKYTTDGKEINFAFRNYRMFNSTHIFPEFIEIEINGKKYSAKTKEFRFYALSSPEYRALQSRFRFAKDSFDENVPRIFR